MHQGGVRQLAAVLHGSGPYVGWLTVGMFLTSHLHVTCTAAHLTNPYTNSLMLRPLPMHTVSSAFAPLADLAPAGRVRAYLPCRAIPGALSL